MPEVDRLEIAIQAEATRASAELDKLIGKLNILSSTLSSVKTTGLTDLSNSITQLSVSMQMVGNVKTASFTRLSNNIQKLGSINTGNMQSIATSINTFANSINTINATTANVQQISTIVNSVSKFGSVSMQKAATNLPLLANALKNFMATISTAPNVSSNIINMTNAMANLASFGSKYNATINSMSRAANTMTKANNGIVTSGRNMSRSIISEFTRMLASVYTVKRAFDFVGESITRSMDFVETVNLFQTSFKKIGMEAAQQSGFAWGSEAADKFAIGFISKAQAFNDRITDALSLDPDTTMNYQAVFAQMANAIGLTTDTVMNMSESFTLLGNDIASLWNLKTETAMEKLQSGLAGQVRPLRELGIDITQASLQLTAYRYGITDSVTKMSQAAKTQLRWLTIMDQSEVAFGDMAKTIDSPANQLRILEQQWNNLTRSIGNLFLPIVTTVLPYINALVIALRKMIDTLAAAVGFELPDFSDSDIYRDVTGDIIDSNDDMTNSANGATSANEKLKKSLLGIDELNILSEKATKSGSGSAGGGSGYPGLDDVIGDKTASYMAKFNEELDNMSNKAEEAADKIVGFFKDIADASKPTLDALQKLYNEGLSKLGGFAFGSLKSFYNDFLVPVGTWVLGQGLPSLFNTLNNLLNAINWEKLTSAFSNFFRALAPFAIGIGTGLISFIDELVEILTPAIVGIVNGIAGALNLVADAINAIPEDVTIALGGAIGGLVTAILAFKAANSVISIIKNVRDGLETFIITLMVHPWLAVAAGIAAIAGAALALDKAKFNNSELGKYVQKLDDLIDSSKEFNEEVDKMLEDHDERKKDIEAEYGAISILAGKYFELADKSSLSNEQQLLLKTYANQLIEKIPELSGLIDDQTGAYSGTKAEIEALITKTKEYYLVQAAQEDLIDIAKDQYQAEKNLKDLETERSDLLKTIKEKQDLYNEALKTGSTNSATLTQEQKEHALKTIELSGQITNLEGKLGDLDDQINDTKGTQKDLSDAWTYATDYIAEYSDGVNTAKSDLGKLQTQAGETGKTLKDQDYAGAAKSQINKFNSVYEKDKTGASTLYSWVDALGDVIKNYKLPVLKTRVDVDTSQLTEVGARLNVNSKITLQPYASGGFPETGEVFTARENGIPEMIGRIGRKTTVANNDQIVQSVSGGVANAIVDVMAPMLMSMSGNNSGGDIIVENTWVTSDEKLYQSTQRGKLKSDRRFQTVSQF